ncbi:MAG: FAD-dependent oxidoreductase [Rhizobiales bacterium]|nr:FAD-dependent oxidoreductase [Hyphomicrobiales bacterium]
MSTSTDPLLQPLKIRHVTIKNRIMSTSHAAGIDEEGLTTLPYQMYHEEKAKGGIGLTMFGGSSNVSTNSQNTFHQLRVSDDRCIPHLTEFAERIHKHGCKIMCQITHLGRRSESYSDSWLPAVAPSAIRETLHRSFPKAMDSHDIASVVRDFGDAAYRCKTAGLDGIETLAGGHLIGQFFSPATNKRTDGYGGSIENRCRFGLEVYEEIRRRVGDDFLVGFRFVVDEAMAGGLTFEDCVTIAGIFEKAGYLDFFNAVYGRMDTAIGLARDNMPGMASPIAPWLEKAAAFKREVGLPVFHAARIADIASARHAVREGLIDMAGMTRAHIADPHIVNKIMRGEEERIRPCVGATHCMSEQRPVCLHNPSTGRETYMGHDVPRAETPGRKVVVIGGGPAGLEAARVCALRGHNVTLFEAAAKLGGQVLMAATGSWRKDVSGIVDWRANELDHLGVNVRINKYAEADGVMALEPDVVIVATGGLPDLDWLAGAEHATSAWDALSGDGADSGQIVIYDGTGRHPAATCAERLASAGAEVRMVSLDDSVAQEIAYAERVIWKKRLYELEVPVTFDSRLLKIEKSGNRLKATFQNELTESEFEMMADQVVVEHGTQPLDEAFHALRAGSSNDGVVDEAALINGDDQPAGGDGSYQLYRIGDAVVSRNIAAATYDAFRLCRAL